MDRIKENLATFVVLAIFGPAVGWFLGTSQTAQIARDVADIKTVVGEIKVREQNHDDFMNCAKTKFKLIEAGAKPKVTDCVEGEVR